jgi:hypothetical protein
MFLCLGLGIHVSQREGEKDGYSDIYSIGSREMPEKTNCTINFVGGAIRNTQSKSHPNCSSVT